MTQNGGDSEDFSEAALAGQQDPVLDRARAAVLATAPQTSSTARLGALSLDVPLEAGFRSFLANTVNDFIFFQ